MWIKDKKSQNINYILKYLYIEYFISDSISVAQYNFSIGVDLTETGDFS